MAGIGGTAEFCQVGLRSCHAHPVSPTPQAQPADDDSGVTSSDGAADHNTAADSNPASRLAELLANVDLASDDTQVPSAPTLAGSQSNDEALLREVPPHHG
jgi:hypothetical protein